MKNTMTAEQTERFIEWKNDMDFWGMSIYRSFDDIAERYGEDIESEIAEFLEEE